MDRKGDLGLARQLQAEFGKAKPARQRGHHVGGRDVGGGDLDYAWPPLEPQKQNMRPSQAGPSRSAALAWQGKLVTNDSPGKKTPIQPTPSSLLLRPDENEVRSRIIDAAMFFCPQKPCPSMTSTSPQGPTPSNQPASHQGLQQSGLGNGAYAPGPLRQTTNQLSPKLPLNRTRTVSNASSRREGRPRGRRAEESEDTMMEGVEFSSPVQPDRAVTGPPKGLSASMWNPANRDVHADFRARQALSKPPSNNSAGKEAAMVTSGLVKGPGLSASR